MSFKSEYLLRSSRSSLGSVKRGVEVGSGRDLSF